MSSGLVQWTGHQDNMWHPVATTTKNISPGHYLTIMTMMGWRLQGFQPSHDFIIKLGVAQQVFDNIQKFWKSADKYKSLGLLHKRGILMYGPPGTGKSMSAMLIADNVVTNRGMVLSCNDPMIMPTILSSIRQVEPELPIVCIWEDIDRWCNSDDPEGYRACMASLLDGEHQVNNIVHMATTNVIEDIDSAFSNRPGRFDDVIYVGAPDKGVRQAYLKHLLPNADPRKIEELAEKSEGLLLSHLKDTIVSTFVLDHPVDDTIARLKKMMNLGEQIEKDRKEKKANQQKFSLHLPYILR